MTDIKIEKLKNVILDNENHIHARLEEAEQTARQTCHITARMILAATIGSIDSVNNTESIETILFSATEKALKSATSDAMKFKHCITCCKVCAEYVRMLGDAEKVYQIMNDLIDEMERGYSLVQKISALNESVNDTISILSMV